MKIFGVFFFLSCAFQTALACTCARLDPEPRAADLLKDITVVFQGRVISIGPSVSHELKSSRGKYYPGPTTYEVEFEVLKKWKGVESKKIKIETETLSCHTKFEVDKEYFVLATGEKPTEAGYCTSRYISPADAEKEYGAGTVPEESQTALAEEADQTLWSRLWQKIGSFFS